MTRTAVITGGASGLGEACARRFAAEGARVWILDANAARAADVAGDIGDGARSAGVDVTDEAALLAVAERIEGDTGAPDILVTSAGILETVATVMDEDMDIHDRVWAVNYRGTVSSCRAFGRQMRAAGRGAIVTIGSVNSFSALPLPAYGPSKTAILRLTQILSVELGRHGVRVNAVAPTYVITPAMQARIDAGERDPAVIRASGALDMLVMPRHIADVVAFLCSDAAAAITGVTLPVDAGYAAAVSYKSFAGGLPWKA
ncbi:MAG TPA: SDR family oxidoreductase [Amaricoccus sp.]|uniref:SDR family NAD(P)-dependent oxidoreductase n=1 Tax=Amaricoccus sp. TaxID=1872485 RepID=UPI002C8E000F|nr:SDR family oxidoreductase [Amaricoccus sp.]HMQ93451.1 SDR family oxidoreductase [Amaricoccus sp.]HMR54035.1 SDR family oxidoreductase [Amaricoccus sp.]HMR61952.1 SDR family oxidoreductase [Amaricoccus sp.]HMU01036.1 SDR family oxidoreductase [Amaricoccus sp.]